MKNSSAGFTESRQIQVHDDFIRMIQANPHKVVPFFLPEAGGYVRTLYPSQVAVVQGQTSNGKSIIMEQWARHLASGLPKDRPEACVIVVDTEVPTEVRTTQDYGKFDISIESLIDGSYDENMYNMARRDISFSGILRVSASFMEGVDVSELNYSRIQQEIYGLRDQFSINYDPVAIFLDYVQSMADDPSYRGTAHGAINRDVSQLRGLGIKFICPIIIAAQSKQGLGTEDVYHKDLPIPGPYAIQGSSGIIQKSQLGVSIIKASKIWPINDIVEVPSDNVRFKVTDLLFFVQIVKQQGNAPSGAYYPCLLDPRTQLLVHAPDVLLGAGRNGVSRKGQQIPF